MRRGERQVGEERLARLAVTLQVAEQAVGVEVAGVEVVGDRHVLAILQVTRLVVAGEHLGLVHVAGAPRHQGVGAFEATGRGVALGSCAQVPLAGHESVVADVPQQFGESRHAAVQLAFVARLALLFRLQVLGHGAKPRLVVVDAGEQHRTAHRAGRAGVEIGQAHALVGQPLQAGGGYLSAEGRGIGEAEVIGDDQQDVRARWRRLALGHAAEQGEQQAQGLSGDCAHGATFFLDLYGGCRRSAWRKRQAQTRPWRSRATIGAAAN